MKKLLIGYEGSHGSDAALQDLTRAGLPDELDVLVMAVADVWLPEGLMRLEGPQVDSLPKPVRKARAQALHEIESIRKVGEKGCEALNQMFPKWRVRSLACADSPGWALVRQANEWGADLVVVGSHTRSIIERLFLGSVAAKVAAEAHCSVRIARPRQHTRAAPLKIMLAIDGSEASDAAVQVVAARKWPEASEFCLVTVSDHRLEAVVAWPGADTDRWPLPQSNEASEWICRLVERSVNHLRAAGLQVETQTFDGDPKSVLLREAAKWETDCLFLGARGLHHGGRLFLGTLASAISTRAHCSVEIVRSQRSLACNA